MSAIFSGPLAQAIGWALLHLLWQGVLVAAILAAALALLQRQSANARYLASCGALVIIVALSFITAYRAYEPIRDFGPSLSAAPLSFAAMATDVMIAPGSVSAPDRLALFTSYASSHLPQIVLLWLIGVTLLSARLIAGWIGAHRLAVRYSHPAEARWERAMERIAESLNLRKSIRLLESAAVEVPTVVGWLRPVVLLPVATLSGLSTDQIEMILAHELAHIRRHDFIVNLLQSTVETLFFYQPAVWWISRRIRVEREHCCDDLAVAVSGDPIRYARALTRFEELRIDAAQTILAASGGSLLSRIRRLVVVHGESANWSSRWAAGTALLTVVVALLIGPAFPLFAKHEENPPAPAPATVVKATADPSKTVVTVEASNDDGDESDDVENDMSDDPADVEAPTPDPQVAPRARVFEYRNIHRTPMAAVAPAIALAPMIASRVMASMVPMAPMAPMAPMLVMEGESDHKIVDEKKLTVDDLIALRSSGVTPTYIEEMRAIGLGTLSLNDLIAMRVQGVSPEYVRGLRAAGIDVHSVDAVISMRVQGVTGDYIQGMRAAGYDKLSAQDLVAMRVQGVTPRYVQEMAGAGYKGLSPKDLIVLRVQGVRAEFVKSLAEAGYTNLTVRDLVRLAASGVNAEFIRELAKYRSKP